MVSTVSLLDEIYDQLKVVANDSASLDDADKHVGLLNRTKDIQTPFFGFEWSSVPNNRGMGGNREVESIEEYDADATSIPDTLDVVYGRDYTMTVDFGVVVDGDNARLRDKYYENVQAHFSSFADKPSSLNEDVDRVREQSATPSPPGADGNASVRLTFEIDYTATQTDTVPAAKDVSLDLDVDGTDTYPENYET